MVGLYWKALFFCGNTCGNLLKHSLSSPDLAIKAMSKYSRRFTIKVSAAPIKLQANISHIPWCCKRSTCSCQAGRCRKCTCRKRSRRPFWFCGEGGGVELKCFESRLKCMWMVYIFPSREELVLIPTQCAAAAQNLRLSSVWRAFPA
jgi:hypothetical protein